MTRALITCLIALVGSASFGNSYINPSANTRVSFTSTGGAVWGWGDDNFDELGVATQTNCVCLDSPVRIPRLKHIVQVSAGEGSALAVDTHGQVWSWGYDADGEAGRGLVKTSGCQCVAPRVIPGLSDMVAISTSSTLMLALDSGGRVWAWGSNSEGQLGMGYITTNKCRCLAKPHRIPSLRNIRTISAGVAGGAAVSWRGRLWTWGDDLWGEIGNNTHLTTGCRCVPRPTLVPRIEHAVAVTANGDAQGQGMYSAVLLQNGRVKAWGYPGQLGVDAAPSAACACITHPVYVSRLKNVRQLSALESNSAVLRSGELKTWGDNNEGELGMGTTGGPILYPSAASAVSKYRFKEVDAGIFFTVGLTRSGQVAAWGENDYDALGRGFVSNNDCYCEPEPATVLSHVQVLSANDDFVLVLRNG